MRHKIIAEISRWVEEEYRLGSTVGQKWRGTRRYCKPRNFLFQFAINKSTTPSLTGVPPVTALSKVRRRRKKTRKGRATGEGGRRERWCNSVELKELKDASLFVSADSLPRLLYAEKGETREKKKDVGKFAPFLLRSRFSRAASSPSPPLLLGLLFKERTFALTVRNGCDY